MFTLFRLWKVGSSTPSQLYCVSYCCIVQGHKCFSIIWLKNELFNWWLRRRRRERRGQNSEERKRCCIISENTKFGSVNLPPKNIREIKLHGGGRNGHVMYLDGGGERSLQLMSREPEMVNHLRDADGCKGIITKWMDLTRNIMWVCKPTRKWPLECHYWRGTSLVKEILLASACSVKFNLLRLFLNRNQLLRLGGAE
jgi:hypothetical protein